MNRRFLIRTIFLPNKGKLVIRTDFTRSGSLGALFITKKEDPRWDRIETVKHEYGHTRQLRQMGLVDYLLLIMLPSYMELGTESYYRKPWEITADMYGGVDLDLRTSDEVLTQEHIENGKNYLDIASKDWDFWRKFNELKPYYEK